MSFELYSPISGTLRHLNTLADPVFAEEIMGPGFAVAPENDRYVKVCAPTDGTLTHLLPHACAITRANGQQILVHLGIDTVKLGGEGFSSIRNLGDEVSAGDPLIAWDTAPARKMGYPLEVIVVVLCPPASYLEHLPADCSPIEALMPGARVHRASEEG